MKLISLDIPTIEQDWYILNQSMTFVHSIGYRNPKYP